MTRSKWFFQNCKFNMVGRSNCCFGSKFCQEKISEDWTIKILIELTRIKISLIWMDKIPCKLTERELLNNALLPWLRTKEIIKTKFYLFKLLIDMKLTFSEILNILSWTNVEKTFLTCKYHTFLEKCSESFRKLW